MDTIETIQCASLGSRSSGRQTYVSRLAGVVTSFARWMGSRLERRRSRLALLEMTDDQLKDIGVSRCDAYREGIRPVWD